jgi:TonB family protein
MHWIPYPAILALSLGAHVLAVGLVGLLVGGESQPSTATTNEAIAVELLGRTTDAAPTPWEPSRHESPAMEPETRALPLTPAVVVPQVIHQMRHEVLRPVPPIGAVRRASVRHSQALLELNRAPAVSAPIGADVPTVPALPPATNPGPAPTLAPTALAALPSQQSNPSASTAWVQSVGSTLQDNELPFESALVPISKPTPEYPPRALRTGIEGTVTIEFVVNADGSVRDPRVVRAVPPSVFEEAAKRGVLRWKFQPKLVDGRPTPVRARLDINFNLTNE